MNAAPDNVNSFSRGRRWAVGFNVGVSVVALLAIMVMVNYLATRHHVRWHWITGQRADLSPLTRNVLRSLTNEVRVVAFFPAEEDLFSPVKQLLNDYAYEERQLNRRRAATPLLQVELVDYYRDPGRARRLKSQFQLPQLDSDNFILFESQGRTRIVNQAELSDYDFSAVISGRTNLVTRTGFKGEMLFTSALVSVSESRQMKAYFLQGHGEHDPANPTEPVGYGEFAGVLREKNVAVSPLQLSGPDDIPADCSLLIVAGPGDALLRAELERIERYLAQGGRMLALLRSLTRPTGLEQTLERWGVTVGNDVVLDRGNSFTGQDVVVTNFSNHALVRPLLKSQLYLVLPRSVARRANDAGTADAPKVDELMRSGVKGTAVTDIRNGVVYPNPARDRTGAIPLAVAVEKGTIAGVSADRGSTRLVVVGDSLFLGNQALGNYANRDFASLACSWLLDRPQLLGGIGPRPVKQYRVVLTENQLNAARWVLLGAVPGLALLCGLLVWMRRRS